MGLSFGQLWEMMDREKGLGPSVLQGSGDEDQSLEAIRSGLHVRKEGCGSFWEDFITVCGNADAMSALLEVPKEKITGWPTKIRELIEHVEKSDDNEPKKTKNKMLDTGAAPDTFGNDANADMNPYPS